MTPEVIAAGIQAGSSLLGGMFGGKPESTNEATRAGIFGQAQGAREAGARYGFNPLTLLGVSSPIAGGSPDGSMMGQAIANAGLALADGITNSAQAKAYREALEEQNKELRKELDSATLRPAVAGIYGAPSAASVGPDLLQAMSVRKPLVGDVPIEHKWIKIWDERERRFTWYPNPDLMDAGPAEMATGIGTIGAAEGAQHGTAGGFDFMLNPGGGRQALERETPWVSYKKPGSDDGPKPPRIEVRP